MTILFIFLGVFILGIYLSISGTKKLGDANAMQFNAQTILKNTEQKEQQIMLDKRKLSDREKKILDKEQNVKTLDKEINIREKNIEELNKQRKELSSEINNLYDEELLKSYKSAIIPNIEEVSSSEIKNNLSLLKIEEKELLVNNAVSLPSGLNLRERNNLKKMILIPLDSEINGLLNKLTLNNIDSTRNRIVKTFDKLNKLFKEENVELSNELLELKLRELELNYSYIVKSNDEKEQQKAIKEQMLEEEKVRKEIDREKKRIDKEEHQFNSEITKLISFMQKASTDVEKVLFADKIRELENKLKELEEIKKNVSDRELNTRAGYVYVISNIGSFGKDIYKIGMTRRLEPMDRVKELGSASVPFEFDVHAMIFSDDAPGLETKLHKHFKENEVNKVNPRKEFFKVSLDDIEKVVLENFNNTVTFTKTALAEQYNRTLELEKL